MVRVRLLGQRGSSKQREQNTQRPREVKKLKSLMEGGKGQGGIKLVNHSYRLCPFPSRHPSLPSLLHTPTPPHNLCSCPGPRNPTLRSTWGRLPYYHHQSAAHVPPKSYCTKLPLSLSPFRILEFQSWEVLKGLHFNHLLLLH